METTKYFTLQTKHFLDLVKTKTRIFITNNLLGTIIRHLSCLNKILFIIQRYFGVKKKKAVQNSFILSYEHHNDGSRYRETCLNQNCVIFVY